MFVHRRVGWRPRACVRARALAALARVFCEVTAFSCTSARTRAVAALARVFCEETVFLIVLFARGRVV
jgi:hypothetical protein